MCAGGGTYVLPANSCNSMRAEIVFCCHGATPRILVCLTLLRLRLPHDVSCRLVKFTKGAGPRQQGLVPGLRRTASAAVGVQQLVPQGADPAFAPLKQQGSWGGVGARAFMQGI